MKPKNCTVLLIDDDSALLRGLHRHLDGDPYRILTAVSAAEAFAIIKRYRVDIVVTDIMMPGMTGTEFLRKLRQQYTDIPAIVLSGSITVDVALEAINELGVFRLLSKPTDIKTLCEAVDAALNSNASTSSTAL